MKTNRCQIQVRSFIPEKISPVLLALAVLGAMTTQAQTLFWNTNGAAGTWTDTNWASSATGPFTTAWTANSNVEFITNSTLTFATTSIGNVTVDSNQTVTVTKGGTLSMNDAVRVFNIGNGALLDWRSQTVTATSTAGITKNGAGTLRLDAWTYTTAMNGGFTLNAGSVIVSGGKSFGNGTMTINGGTLQSSGGNNFLVTNLALGGDFAFVGTGNDYWPASVSLGSVTRNITNNTSSGNSRIFGGVISGSAGAGITFWGGTTNGIINLTNSGNTFTGPITINGSEVAFQNDGSFGVIPGSVFTNAIVIDGGRMTAADGSTSNNAVTFTLNSNRGIQIGATAGTAISVARTNGLLACFGIIADKTGSAGILVKQGAGVLALGGTNTYSGGTFINLGTLQLTNGDNHLPVGSALSLGQISPSSNTGTFDLNGNNQQIAGLNSVAGTNNLASAKNVVTNSAAAATLTISNTTTSIYGDGSATNSGIITGAINLVKSGSGTQILGDTNAYTGMTIVSNGTLLVNGVIGTNFVTISGGTLGGFGIIGGMVTNAAGGNLAPGAGTNAAGTVLTLNTNLTLLAGSTNIVQVSHNRGTSDKVVSSGTITYGGVLVVMTNAGDSAFANGDRFTLFITNGIGASYSGSFASSNLPPLSSGLAWSNSLATDGSIEVISNKAITPPAPVAAFTVASTNFFVAQKVVFTNISAGSITNSAWTFGDGNTANTSGSGVTNNVSNTYTNQNTTNMVVLTARGSGGATSATNYIVVYPTPKLNQPVLFGGGLVFSISNAAPGTPFVILTCTNLATNTVNWTVATNDVFDVNGAYNYTNPAATNMAAFFRLKSPP